MLGWLGYSLQVHIVMVMIRISHIKNILIRILNIFEGAEIQSLIVAKNLLKNEEK